MARGSVSVQKTAHATGGKAVRGWLALLVAVLLAAGLLGVVAAGGQQAFAAASVDDVRKAIQALPVDPTDFKESDKARVEALKADFDALSDADRATLDTECSHSGTAQPLGRVLEGALWAVWSYGEVDNTTTLRDGTYNATTSPALASEYSKGKSTSPRQRPWSVKSVTVTGGKATATVTVESSTYTGIWIGGTTYPKTNTSGNCEFAGVPINLNSTFYFAGISSSMPEPIAFSLTTTIEEPPCKVTFTDGLGKTLKTQEVALGDSATAPADPTRKGYTFTGWDNSFDNVKSDLTVNATWKINTYKVTFTDGLGKTLKTEDVDYGKAATAPASPTREGYAFDGWDKAFTSIEGDLTVNAKWKINTYTVTFTDGQGSRIGQPQTVEHGKAATAPAAPTRTGYTFDGWDKAFTNVTSDLTVNANWKINTYTVTFTDGQGNRIGQPQTVEYGKPATAPEAPTRTGHTFAGWDKAFTNVTEDMTVNATWKISTYTVTFVDEDGATLKEATRYNYGTKAADIEKPADPVKESSDGYDYVFAGWEPEVTDVTGNATYRAKYTQSKQTFEIKFEDEDGTTLKETARYDYGTEVADIDTPADPTKTQTAEFTYLFVGWNPSLE